MTWEVAVAGTLHRDDVTTPLGRTESLGGSAVYFALAASRQVTVHVNGITGEDTATAYRELLDSPLIDLGGLVVSPRPTFHWHAVHDFSRWVTASESAEEGCDPDWRPSLAAVSRAAEVLFIGSMRPEIQQAVLDQSTARLVACDSMTVFIDGARAAVMAVVERSDVVFLDERELAALTRSDDRRSDDWRSSARRLCGTGRLRAVVVKRGPSGAALVTAGAIDEIPAAPASVADPTGAGDALAGGLLGHCARVERDDRDVLAGALAEGVRCAADAIVSVGTEGLRRGRAV